MVVFRLDGGLLQFYFSFLLNVHEWRRLAVDPYLNAIIRRSANRMKVCMHKGSRRRLLIGEVIHKLDSHRYIIVN